MKFEISFRHLEHTESIDAKIRKKVLNFADKHLSSSSNIEWSSWVEHNEHVSTFHARDKGKEYYVKAKADNLYKTIDLAIQKMESQFQHKNH